MKGSKALLATLAMTAGLLALVVGLRGEYARLAAEHWRTQLDTVPDDHAPTLLREVAELGEPGIPVLVEALGSERGSVARAGKQVLWEQLERWQILGTPASSPKLAVLADALAGRVEQFGPPARHAAADLAARILLWPLDSHAVDRQRVIASCEKVFRASAVGGGAVLEGSLAERQAPPTERADRVPGRLPPVDDPIELGRSLVDLSRLPGGAIPIDSFPGPAAPERGGDEPAGGIATGRPRRLAFTSAARPLNGWEQSDRPPAAGEESQAAPESEAPSTQTPAGSIFGRFLSLMERAGALGGNPSDELSQMQTVELMRCLDSPQETKASGARAELIRRGFTEVHLDLARRLFDPDPEVRKQLARLLPGVQSVDAAPWLQWLSRDPDPEVRLAAIGLIATTADAELLEQTEQAAREDPDPRIRRQAERIAERHNRQRR